MYLYRKLTKVRTSTYEYVLLAVHCSTLQYMAVQGSTWKYMIVHFLVRTDSMLVRSGTSEYKPHGFPGKFLLDFAPEFLPC
jgi:hypothetical protein